MYGTLGSFASFEKILCYHLKDAYLPMQNDKLKLLKPGSLQHLGENMLPFLLQVVSSTDLPKELSDERGGTSEDHTIYFDVLVWQNISLTLSFCTWCVALVILWYLMMVNLQLEWFPFFPSGILVICFYLLMKRCFQNLRQ